MLIDKVRDHLNVLNKTESKAIRLFNQCWDRLTATSKENKRLYVKSSRYALNVRLLFDFDYKKNAWTRGAWLFDLIRTDEGVTVTGKGCEKCDVLEVEDFERLVAPIIARELHARGTTL